MFGLEKKKNNSFEFDLEKELKGSSKKQKELLKNCEAKTQELKNILREGNAAENFDQYGIIMQGYAALEKVTNKVSRAK